MEPWQWYFVIGAVTSPGWLFALLYAVVRYVMRNEENQ